MNSVSPGFVKVVMHEFKKKIYLIYINSLFPKLLLKDGEDCEEVADLILFLLSNNSLYITGNNIFIDGGWSAN